MKPLITIKIQNIEKNILNVLFVSNWSKKIILVSGTVIEEKYTTPNTIKVWIINLNFGELIFFMSDKKPTQNIKKT